MSRFWDGDPVLRRVIRWTPTLSVPLGGATWAWVTLTLTLPETVDWNKALLVINGKGFGRQMGAANAYGVIWRPGVDGNSATIYVKCQASGTKTWTPECELWILDDEYAAYHLHGNWDTANTQALHTSTATCGDARAAERGHMWLANMAGPCGDGTVSGACFCNDNPYISQVESPFRDAGNNSCLRYHDGYGSSNIFYSFTYVYKR